jgi:hypothetical protein
MGKLRPMALGFMGSASTCQHPTQHACTPPTAPSRVHWAQPCRPEAPGKQYGNFNFLTVPTIAVFIGMPTINMNSMVFVLRRNGSSTGYLEPERSEFLMRYPQKGSAGQTAFNPWTRLYSSFRRIREQLTLLLSRFSSNGS